MVLYRDATSSRAAHDVATCREIARRLAALKGYRFAGDYDSAGSYPSNLYFVPLDTLVGIRSTRELGITGDHDLFGGVVAHPFVATKCISHPLVDADACAPDGWSSEFAHDVVDAVLDGLTAFSVDDAMRAGMQLLRHGPVRIKRALGIGGVGQTVVGDTSALTEALADMDAGEIASHGISLEQHLTQVTTYSVGQVRVDALVASYCGTQRLTANNEGTQVYGGSDLYVVRGDFDALLAYDHSPAARRAIEQARQYDAAAFRRFAGLVASRRNYDIARGLDPAGRPRSGVLEQSWRVGGASGAEVEALTAFHADPALRRVRASSSEVSGECATLPSGAVVYFRGHDARVGPLTKYTVTARVDA